MRLIIAMVLVAISVSAYGQSFVVTDRNKPEFVINSSPNIFVVTDHTASPVTPPVQTIKAEPAVNKRPVVTLYSASWCAPCRGARQELANAKLPFDINIVDVTSGGQPAYVDSIPYFEWPTPNGRKFAKWNGVDDLVGRWALSQKPAPKAASQIDSLTPEQRAMYERAKSAGYSDEQIRRYAVRHGIIK